MSEEAFRVVIVFFLVIVFGFDACSKRLIMYDCDADHVGDQWVDVFHGNHLLECAQIRKRNGQAIYLPVAVERCR